jgi:hypothetical protein
VDFAAVEIVEEPPRAGWYTHGDDWDVTTDRWLYYQTLQDSGVLVITGPSQSGKTFLLAALAHSVASGEPFFGTEPDDRGAALVVFGGSEGAGFKNRMIALHSTERLPVSSYKLKENLGSAAAVPRLIEELKAQCDWLKARFGFPVRLVVIETLSSCGLIQKDENANAECAGALRDLARISAELTAHQGVGVLCAFTHHPPKEGTGPRGGGALLANADCALEIEREGEAAVRTLRLTKARNASQRALGTFTLLPYVLGHDHKGRPVTTCRLSVGAIGAAAVIEGALTNEARLRRLIRDLAMLDVETGELTVAVPSLRTRWDDARADLPDDKSRRDAMSRALRIMEAKSAIRRDFRDGTELIVIREASSVAS